MLKNLLLCVLVLVCCSLTAQKYPFKKKYDYDTNYIASYLDHLNIALMVDVKASTLNALYDNSTFVNYVTNLPRPTYGLMFSYKWINARVSIPIGDISAQDKSKGETKSQSFGLGVTRRKWYFRGQYDRYKGYYMANPENLDADYFDSYSDYPLFPDMISNSFSLSGFYGSNGKRYSHRGLLWQSEFQKKSAGTVIFGGTAGYRNVQSDPASNVSDSIYSFLQDLRFYTVSVNWGYSYTFCFLEHFNASAMILPGLAYLKGEYKNRGEASHGLVDKSAGLTADLRVQIFYDRKRFYTGVSYTGYASANWLSEANTLGSSQNYFRVNFGYRFGFRPQKWLEPFYLSN